MSFKDCHVPISVNTGNRILWNCFCNGCNVLDINFIGCIIFGGFIWFNILFFYFSVLRCHLVSQGTSQRDPRTRGHFRRRDRNSMYCQVKSEGGKIEGPLRVISDFYCVIIYHFISFSYEKYRFWPGRRTLLIYIYLYIYIV